MEELDGLSSFLSERRGAVADARMREDGRTDGRKAGRKAIITFPAFVRSFVPFVPFPSFRDTDFNWREEQVG